MRDKKEIEKAYWAAHNAIISMKPIAAVKLDLYNAKYVLGELLDKSEMSEP